MEYQRKPIKGYEGRYEIDTLGNVWSLHYHNTNEEKVLAGGIDKDGYRHVQLKGISGSIWRKRNDPKSKTEEG